MNDADSKLFGSNLIIYGLAKLLTEHFRNSLLILSHLFSDYFSKQYRSSRAIVVDSDLDKEIPPCPEAIRTYFSFIPFIVGSLGLLRNEFEFHVREDINWIMDDMIDFYKNTGFIFEKAPTTLLSRTSKGIGLKILHFLDRPRNYFPSLHVVLVGYVYFRTCDIIDRFSNGKAGGYDLIKTGLFNKTFGIMEACLVTRQHGIRDIAGGLAVVTAKNPDFDRIAGELIDSMFLRNKFGMSDRVIDGIREEIKLTYRHLFDRFNNNPGQSYSDVLIDFIRKA